MAPITSGLKPTRLITAPGFVSELIQSEGPVPPMLLNDKGCESSLCTYGPE